MLVKTLAHTFTPADLEPILIHLSEKPLVPEISMHHKKIVRHQLIFLWLNASQRKKNTKTETSGLLNEVFRSASLDVFDLAVSVVIQEPNHCLEDPGATDRGSGDFFETLCVMW